MKTTIGWLKTHFETDASPEAIAERLIMLGHDVEGGREPHRKISIPFHGGFGHLRRTATPNADRLKVCVVDTGKERGPGSSVAHPTPMPG